MKKAFKPLNGDNFVRNSRTVEVYRGPSGYGFTISGQKPSILSNIVENSAAEQAGLRTGDYLLAVNYEPVHRWTHDLIIQFINRCQHNVLILEVSDNYFEMDNDENEDDEDDEGDEGEENNENDNNNDDDDDDNNNDNEYYAVKDDNDIINEDYGCDVNAAIANVVNGNEAAAAAAAAPESVDNSSDVGNERKLLTKKRQTHLSPKSELIARKIRDYTHIEYKFFMKYVGSIELSNEFLLENKKNYFDTILKCIKKLKNEKRIPYSIVMTILPSYLMLTNDDQMILATFSSKQILCINEERNSNYFGIITHNPIDLYRIQCSSDNHSMISCHVFYVDKSLLDHKIHCYFNEKLHLNCNFDIITGHCLQFPENSQYIQTIIRNLYGLPMASAGGALAATSNSPRVRKSKQKTPYTPSSSNSDSGVGIRDFSPISQLKKLDLNCDKNNQKTAVDNFKKPLRDSLGQRSGHLSDVCGDSNSQNTYEHLSSLSNLHGSLSTEERRNRSFSAISAPDISQLPSKTVTSADSGQMNASTTFEKFLNNEQSLKQFQDFLNKEYSIENLNFWLRVQKYRNLSNSFKRKMEAKNIYDKHLRDGAPELINVDHKTRSLTLDMIGEAKIDLFDEVQEHIFNLMKFDSYPRFLKSARDSNERELKRRSSPAPSSTSQERRRSLLPWHRKSRYKTAPSDSSQNSGAGPHSGLNKDTNSNHSSMSSLDMAIVCNTRNDNIDVENLTTIDTVTRKQSSLCRISIDNEFTTVVHLSANETVNQLIYGLLEKRGLRYLAFEVFKLKSSKPLNQNEDSSILSGQEIYVERRIFFKIFLPNGKLISVKSKVTKILEDVLRPILKKYCYEFDEMLTFYKDNTAIFVDCKLNVTVFDGEELTIDYDPNKKSNSAHLLNSSTVFKRFQSNENEEVPKKQPNTFEKFLRRQSFIYDRSKKEYKVNNLQENLETKKPLIAKLKSGAFLQQTASSSALKPPQ